MIWLSENFSELLIAIGLIFVLLILVVGSLLASTADEVWAQCRDCGEWFNEIGERQNDAPIICTHPLKGICPKCLEIETEQVKRLKL